MIYCVEDDSSIRDLMVYTLQAAGFSACGCADGEEFWQSMHKERPELVVLDIMLPGEDGISILKKLRAAPATTDIPMIMATAKGTEFDRVIGLDLGADDYLTKPYSPAVLLAHVERLLQRANPQVNAGISYNGIAVNASRSEVSFQGATAELSRNELRILSALIRARGAIVSRQELMYELWQSDEFIDDNTLTVNVNRLRKLLQRLGVSDDALKTHRGQGYSL